MLSTFAVKFKLRRYMTAIGRDHLEALGGSLGHVVNAKAGIVRPRRPTFIAPQPSLDAEAGRCLRTTTRPMSRGIPGQFLSLVLISPNLA